MSDGRSPHVLLVEDDHIDATMLTRAATTIDLPIRRVNNGTEALTVLQEDCVPGSTPNTQVVLLDLNMPGLDGYTVLNRIKANPTMCRIPVVVLSSSNRETDISRVYESCGAAYLKKPVGLDGYLELVSAVKGFWFGLVQVPAV